mgnify:CR=1 FL=1
MPQSDKSEHQQRSRNCALGASDRHVDVAYDPEIVRAMPGTPEAECAVIVGHAADHVLWRVDAVSDGP